MPQKPPFPLQAHGPPPNTPMKGQPHSPPQTTARSVHALSHYARKSHWLQWDASHKPPNFPFMWGNLQYQLPASSSDLTDPPFRSNQLFSTIHHTNRHTVSDRQTDGPDDKTCSNTCLCSINDSNTANNMKMITAINDYCKPGSNFMRMFSDILHNLQTTRNTAYQYALSVY